MRVCGVVCAVVLWPAGPVAADAAGPTDYRSVITEVIVDDAVTPVITTDGAVTVPGAVISVEGHDSFLWLRTASGSTASIPGYEGEPYLRIDADGSVWRNQRSFSTYYNQDRYGDAARPAIVDHSAEPLWEQVDDDGSWAWHDHRIHLMESAPPIGAEPGDEVVNAVVPLVIDGRSVAVRVVSTLQPPPSIVAPVVGAVIGCMLMAAGVMVWRRQRHIASIAAVAIAGIAAGAAVVAGAGWWRDAPSDTAPSLTWWALPATAVVAVVVAAVTGRRSVFIATAAVVVAAVQIVVWTVGRIDALSAALIPTVLPAGLDRGLTVMAVITAVGAAAMMVITWLHPASVDAVND